MSAFILAYVTTFRPSKSDNVHPDILKPIRKKFAYGIRVFADEEEIGFASSWVRSMDAQYCEMLGVSGLVDALEGRDELPFLKIIFNSAQFDVRLRNVERRFRQKQRGKELEPIKKERQWEDMTRRLQRFEKGIREAVTENETKEIGTIKEHLKAEFYCGDRFSLAEPPEFELRLLDF